jgi:hypothetical protein
MADSLLLEEVTSPRKRDYDGLTPVTGPVHLNVENTGLIPLKSYIWLGWVYHEIYICYGRKFVQDKWPTTNLPGFSPLWHL